MEVRAAAEGGCKRVICRVGSLRRAAIWSSQIMSEHQLVMGARGSGPGAGLGTRRPPRIRTLNTSAGHLRPTPRPLSYNLHLHVSHLIHQVSHRRLEVVAPARALPCARMHIGLSDTRAYDASLVVTPREGSHARFEPLEHRTHVRALRCALHAAPNTHCPTRSCTLSFSLFLSHALHIHKSPGRRFSGSGCAIPHASPGTALRCRHARRLRVRNLKRRRQSTWPWPNVPWVRCQSWMRKFYLKVRAPSMPNVGSPRGLACTFRASRAPCSCSGAPLGAAPNTHG